MADRKECFVISPIGEEETEEREHADNVLDHVVREPIVDKGYQPVRADQLDEPGSITRQVIERVHEAPLVIADLSRQNANVFYELAIRHSAKKPVIQIIQRGEEIPFDIQNTRTVFYDLEDVPTNEEAKSQIRAQIDHIEESDTVESPISETLQFKAMQESGEPEQQSIADLRKDISDLQSTVRSLENIVRNTEKKKQKPVQSINEAQLNKAKTDFRRLNKTTSELGHILQENEFVQDEKLHAVYEDINMTLESLGENIKYIDQPSLDEF